MNDQKSLSDSQLLSILTLSNDATAIYSSYNLNIALANDAMLTLWGKTRAIIGMSLPDAVPELKSQNLPRFCNKFGSLEKVIKLKMMLRKQL